MKIIVKWIIGIVLMNSLILGQDEISAHVQLKIESGIIEGFQDSTGLKYFLGIPFAKPPIGNFR